MAVTQLLIMFMLPFYQIDGRHLHHHRALNDESEDMLTTLHVDAVVGKPAFLPCDIEPESNEDRVYMVLWFRKTGTPIYSFDVRGRSFKSALHWSDPLALGDRGYFITMTKPAAMRIEHVQPDDAGAFHCRVDFKNSPTRNVQIWLQVIVPPHQLLLFDEKGWDVSGMIGPLREGDDYVLTCELRGGDPQPEVRWVMNNKLLNHSIVANNGKVFITKVHLKDAQRDWHNVDVKCIANNTSLLTPHSRSARIAMHLNPITASIVNKPKTLNADVRVTLTCVSEGSRPQAEMTWHRNSGRHEKGQAEIESNDTVVVSHLTFYPQPEDDGATIRCQAENPITLHAVEDSFELNVLHKPVVTVSLGSTLNANDIKEGDDVYFECNVKSNPKHHRIQWYHDNGKMREIQQRLFDESQDAPINQTIPSRKVINTKSLVLRKVSRKDIGLYMCRATNDIGETNSSQVFLRVQYPPTCRYASHVLVGAPLDVQLRIRCVVRADPADVIFSWKFNNSGEVFTVSPARYGPSFLVASGGTASELQYNAASERDYGWLTCTSSNSVGHQQEPCVFDIIRPSFPEPVQKCKVHKIPRKSEPLLAVLCKIGLHHGMKNYYTLEATGEPPLVLVNYTTGNVFYDGRRPRQTVWLNVSWTMIEDLKEDQNLQVIAHNVLGSSAPLIIRTFFRNPVKTETIEIVKEKKVPLSVWFGASLAVLSAAAGMLVTYMLLWPPTGSSSATPTKRPSQSVVQVDSEGRRYLYAYPDSPDKETKPDILIPKQDTARPRVILEANGNNFELQERPGRSNQSSRAAEEVVGPVPDRAYNVAFV